jgi:hypothetical protein
MKHLRSLLLAVVCAMAVYAQLPQPGGGNGGGNGGGGGGGNKYQTVKVNGSSQTQRENADFKTGQCTAITPIDNAGGAATELTFDFDDSDPDCGVYLRGTEPPATCTVGEVFFDTDAAAGSEWLGCKVTNTWTALGGSGGGGGVQRGAYSSLPTCNSGANNTLYKLTDGVIEAQCNGTSWQWYFGGLSITLPGLAATWTTSFAGATTLTDSAGTLLLQNVDSGASRSIAYKAISTWTNGSAVEFYFYQLNYYSAQTEYAYGVFLRTSGASGGCATGPCFRFFHETPVTTPPVQWLAVQTEGPGATANQTTLTYHDVKGPFVAMRIRRDNTNRYYEYGTGGYLWLPIFTEALNTSFNDADVTHYGFGASGASAGRTALQVIHARNY